MRVLTKKNVFLLIILILFISLFLGYSYINSDISSNSILTINKYSCAQSNLYERIACMSTMDNIESKYVSSLSGINFENISSNTNGKGIYEYSSTITDEYPIYYYRGAVDNNNVKFAGFCWKIVRTTSTGGTKLIYNGEPNNSDSCDNPTNNISELSTKSRFNAPYNSIAYAGYMFGDVYASKNDKTISNQYYYGNSFEFIDEDENISGDGYYKLVNPTNNLDDINNHHYTCWSNDPQGTCNEISYIFIATNDNTKYINFIDGIDIDTAIEEMRKNNNDSIIKTNVDNWFRINIDEYFDNLSDDYSNHIEDTIWCNDRSFNHEIKEEFTYQNNNAFIPNGGDASNLNLLFNTWIRMRNKKKPSLDCDYIDSFSTGTNIGNGKLIYPVGLLTADEALLSGIIAEGTDSDSYLYNGSAFVTMSPYSMYDGSIYLFIINEDGALYYGHSYNEFAIRPVISLKHSKTIYSGDGTPNNPYVIN